MINYRSLRQEHKNKVAIRKPPAPQKTKANTKNRIMPKITAVIFKQPTKCKTLGLYLSANRKSNVFNGKIIDFANLAIIRNS